MNKFYKYCSVPLCTNTTITTPEKLFIHIPKDAKIRKKWFSLARRDPAAEMLVSTSSYFCQDHFDLPNDMENYVEYTTMGKVSKIKMRSGCLPTKFTCQPGRTSTSDICRPAAAKRRRLELVKECEELDTKRTAPSLQFENIPVDLPGTSSDLITPQEHYKPLKIDKAVQTSHVTVISAKRRSECTQTTTKLHKKEVPTSPMKFLTTSKATSPFKAAELRQHVKPQQIKISHNANIDERSDSDVSMYTPSVASLSKASSDTSSIIEPEIQKEKICQNLLKSTVDKIENKPKFYIGVPKHSYQLIKIIQEETGISEHEILLCLKKIRLDSKFVELSDDFAISASYACKIFTGNIHRLALMMRSFIVSLDKEAIKRCLPIAFRKKYYNVTCIIDCLEIEIQKPSKAINQALTWSDYKKANTMKYLISSTPNGLVNYISPGFGGRTTDVCLVENCDFLKCLPSGSHVMADRGFKHIEPLLLGVGCKLIRPPSVESGKRLSKEKVKETKQIASLRIHIERLIRRLREFSMLKPHACLHNRFLGKLDDIIVIACGLINLQDSLLNK